VRWERQSLTYLHSKFDLGGSLNSDKQLSYRRDSEGRRSLRRFCCELGA